MLVLGLAGVTVSGLANDAGEYQLGDRIVEDIVTPVPLFVVDPVATRALKAREELRIPVIFRYKESALAQVEAQLRGAFAQARSNFLALTAESFPRIPLTSDEMDTALFRRVMGTFKQSNKSFPLSESMAREWAGGNLVLPEEIALFARVHQAMTGLIRQDSVTNAPKPGSMVLLVPVRSEAEAITMEDVQARGYLERRTNVLTLSRSRQALREHFAPTEAAMAKFASRWLRENCFMEVELTRIARARHTDALFVADRYQAGELIGRKGGLVDAKLLAALAQLEEKTSASRLAEQVAQEQAAAELQRAVAAQLKVRNQWLLLGLVVVGGMLLASLLVLTLRRRRETSMLPMVLGATTGTPLLTDDGGTTTSRALVATWQQRALLAEQKLEQAHAAIRTGALTQLKEKVVCNLVAQREQILEGQRAAAAELAQLQRRLNELHVPLQERLRTYEARIVDLEKALVDRDEENRELIRTKIETTRRQLEAERSKDSLQFN